MIFFFRCRGPVSLVGSLIHCAPPRLLWEPQPTPLPLPHPNPVPLPIPNSALLLPPHPNPVPSLSCQPYLIISTRLTSQQNPFMNQQKTILPPPSSPSNSLNPFLESSPLHVPQFSSNSSTSDDVNMSVEMTHLTENEVDLSMCSCMTSSYVSPSLCYLSLPHDIIRIPIIELPPSPA